MAKFVHTHGPKYETVVKSLLLFFFVLHLPETGTGPSQAIESSYFTLLLYFRESRTETSLGIELFLASLFWAVRRKARAQSDVTSSSCLLGSSDLCSSLLII